MSSEQPKHLDYDYREVQKDGLTANKPAFNFLKPPRPLTKSLRQVLRENPWAVAAVIGGVTATFLVGCQVPEMFAANNGAGLAPVPDDDFEGDELLTYPSSRTGRQDEVGMAPTVVPTVTVPPNCNWYTTTENLNTRRWAGKPGPGQDENRITVLKEGTEVFVLGKNQEINPDWVKVKWDDNKEGWVSPNYLASDLCPDGLKNLKVVKAPSTPTPRPTTITAKKESPTVIAVSPKPKDQSCQTQLGGRMSLKTGGEGKSIECLLDQGQTTVEIFGPNKMITILIPKEVKPNDRDIMVAVYPPNVPRCNDCPPKADEKLRGHPSVYDARSIVLVDSGDRSTNTGDINDPNAKGWLMYFKNSLVPQFVNLLFRGVETPCTPFVIHGKYGNNTLYPACKEGIYGDMYPK